jgi:hypothetical protein
MSSRLAISHLLDMKLRSWEMHAQRKPSGAFRRTYGTVLVVNCAFNFAVQCLFEHFSLR